MAAKDKPLIGTEPGDGFERQTLRPPVEIVFIALAQRHRFQRAVGAVGPGVIGAFEVLGVARPLRTHFGAAMGAAIVKGVYFAVVVARDDDPVAAHAGGEEIAGLFQLAFMPQPQPDPPENAFLFFLEDSRVGV